MRFSFVILDYLTYQYIYECIESIMQNVDYDDYNIVEVENGLLIRVWNYYKKNMVNIIKHF